MRHLGSHQSWAVPADGGDHVDPTAGADGGDRHHILERDVSLPLPENMTQRLMDATGRCN